MKLIFNSNGYKLYKTTILGYEFGVFETKDKHYMLHAPTGNTKTKPMFDDLVYYNQKLYTGKDLQNIKRNIRQFIKNYNYTNK